MQVDNIYNPQDNLKSFTNFEHVPSSKNTNKPSATDLLIKCPCKQSQTTKNMITCTKCKTQQHQDCMKDLSKMQNYRLEYFN